MSLRRATSDTDAPGSNVCSTSCRLNSRAKLGRLPGASHLLSTISATLVPIKTFDGNQITPVHCCPENGRRETHTLIPVVVLNNAPASVVTPPVSGTEGRKAG